jgi:hypothetical protein
MLMVWTVLEPVIRYFDFCRCQKSNEHRFWGKPQRMTLEWKWKVLNNWHWGWCVDEKQCNEQLLPHNSLYPVILIKLVCVAVILYIPFPSKNNWKQNNGTAVFTCHCGLGMYGGAWMLACREEVICFGGLNLLHGTCEIDIWYKL